MIGLPSNRQIWIAAGVTDLRRGFDGLSALVQTKLEKSPLSGQVFIFRRRRGDLVKLIWFDGDGLCLFCKRLERGKFVWPQATEGSVSLRLVVSVFVQPSFLLKPLDKGKFVGDQAQLDDFPVGLTGARRAHAFRVF